MHLSEKFQQALVYTSAFHADHCHKGSTVPYLSHLLGVTAIALEHGADEDEAIGALLHDSVEYAIKKQADINALKAEIAEKFGFRVLDIVLGCTDSTDQPKPPWKARKDQFLASLATASPSTLLVTLSDKIHNAQAALEDYRESGDAIWKDYGGKKEGTLWYYRALVDTFTRRLTVLDAQESRDPARLKMLRRMISSLNRRVRKLEKKSAKSA